MGVHYDPSTKEPIVTSGGATPSWWSHLGGWENEQLASEPVGSPLWWLFRGIARLEVERPTLLHLEDYWQGRHPLPDIIDADTKRKYLAILEEAKANYMRTVVEVTAERLRVQGLWFPGGDERADAETWGLFEANDLDAWQSVAFEEMLAKRRCYWSVWFDDDGAPRIEIEDALQTWVELVPGSRNRRAAAIKTMVDDWTGDELAEVSTPEWIAYFRRDNGKWTMWADEIVVNRFGEVPIVPMVNKPRLRGADTGFSAIEDVTATQARLNRTILGRMLAGHTSAFLQKWATGIEIPEDEDGNPVAPFKPGVTELWTSEDPGAKFGQFDATDLTNYIRGEEQDLQHIANVTGMPRHYFNPTGQAPSGDAMDSAEARLDAIVLTMQSFAAPAIKEMLRLARRVQGLETPMGTELVWADTGFHSFAQLVDGQMKLVQGGVASKRYAREKVGMSPATMQRVEAEIMAEAFEAELLMPEPEPDAPAPA